MFRRHIDATLSLLISVAAFAPYGSRLMEHEIHPGLWTLVVSTRKYPTLRKVVDPTQVEPVVAVVDG